MEWRQPGGHISFPLLCVASPMETRHHHSGATFSAGDISTNKFVCATERPFREDLRVAPSDPGGSEAAKGDRLDIFKGVPERFIRCRRTRLSKQVCDPFPLTQTRLSGGSQAESRIAAPLTLRRAYQFRGLLVRGAEGLVYIVPQSKPGPEGSHKHISRAMRALHLDRNTRKRDLLAKVVLKRHSIAAGCDNHGRKTRR